MKILIILPLFISIFSLSQEKSSVRLKKSDSLTIQNFNFERYPALEARYPGGPVAMNNYIMENFNVPENFSQQYNDTCVRIFVHFLLDSEGEVKETLVRNPFFESLDAEANRIISEMPNWIPAENNGVLVPSLILLPINICVKN